MSKKAFKFSSAKRLATPGEFQRAFRANCGRSNERSLSVLAVKNDRSYARLGLAISKKRLPNAVDRNRIKRLIRESFRRNQTLLTGLDVVVLNNAGAATQNIVDIAATLHEQWKIVTEQCKNF